MSRWHIAQMNVGTVRFPTDDPRLAGFMNRLDEINVLNRLDEINVLAEASPGFVWRLQSDQGNATDIILTDNPLFIVNMSVWEDVESLFAFVYRSAHQGVMAQRREWFERPDQAYQVLWWIAAGSTPTPQDGLARLRHLRAHGPTPHAFTFRQKFPPPDVIAQPEDMQPQPYCVGWS